MQPNRIDPPAHEHIVTKVHVRELKNHVAGASRQGCGGLSRPCRLTISLRQPSTSAQAQARHSQPTSAPKAMSSTINSRRGRVDHRAANLCR